MKALLLEAYHDPRLTQLPIPEIREDEVLLRVKACAICGSDLHGYTGKSGRRQPPLVMGHEASGVVEKAGPAVSAYKPGDRVVFNSSLYCGQCWYCRRGMENLCVQARVFGVNCDSYKLDGAMAEYLAVPERILYPLPQAMSFVQGALVEPLSIALHAVNRTQIEMDDTVAVIGAGAIGLMLVKALKNTAASRVVAVDVDDFKLECALKAGADLALNTRHDVAASIQKIAPRGADAVFEAVGIGQTVEQALDLARRGGRVTLVGNAQPRAELGMQKIVLKELSVHGAYACANEYETALSLIAGGRVTVDELVSATAPLEEGKQWLDRLARGGEKLIKVVLTL